MSGSRFLRALSSLLVINFSIISLGGPECAMARVGGHLVSHHADSEMRHSHHSQKGARSLHSLSNLVEACDMGCPPAACATGSHCSSLAFGSSSPREEGSLNRAAAVSRRSTSTQRVAHPPEPPPPRG